MLDRTGWCMQPSFSLYMCQSVGGEWYTSSNPGCGRVTNAVAGLVLGDQFIRKWDVVMGADSINGPSRPS